jgi:hypothetical protein
LGFRQIADFCERLTFEGSVEEQSCRARRYMAPSPAPHSALENTSPRRIFFRGLVHPVLETERLRADAVKR